MAGTGSGKRYYYLQYPLGFRRDSDIKRLEKRFGIAAPIVFLEMNAFVADKGFILRRREDETFPQQVCIDLDYEGEEELIGKVIDYCMARGMITKLPDEEVETYYFPWAKEATSSISDEAIRKARWREQKARSRDEKQTEGDEDGTEAGHDGTTLGQCPDMSGTGAGQESDVVRHNKNNNKRDKENKKEIDKERDIDSPSVCSSGDGQTGRHTDGQTDGRTDQHEADFLDAFEGLPVPGGEMWKPSQKEYKQIKDSFPSIDVETQLRKMQLWAQARTQGCLTSANTPLGAVYNWMNREIRGTARMQVQEQYWAERRAKEQAEGRATQRAGGRATADEWAELAGKIEAGEEI